MRPVAHKPIPVYVHTRHITIACLLGVAYCGDRLPVSLLLAPPSSSRHHACPTPSTKTTPPSNHCRATASRRLATIRRYFRATRTRGGCYGHGLLRHCVNECVVLGGSRGAAGVRRRLHYIANIAPKPTRLPLQWRRPQPSGGRPSLHRAGAACIPARRRRRLAPKSLGQI